ncbi:MAG: dienelactone hydrolase family protein [Fimbriimonas sp.]
MRGETIHFSNGSEQVRAYLSPSATGSGPGVIVIQEWWGLVPHIMDIADRFAEAGFTALAPDLFGGESTTDPDDAATLMQALGIANTEAILRKAILTLMTHPATVPNDGVGIVGFCMGGQLAMFAAGNNPVVKATVNFYGIHPKVQPSYRDLNGPVLGIFAENDHMASPSAVEALAVELSLLEKPHEFVTYPGTDHAFFNDTRPEVYNAEAAADAWRRTIEFFNLHLRNA